MGMIVKTIDYKKVAKQKQLAFQIEDWQRQREKLLANLSDLGVKLGDDVPSGQAIAVDMLEHELKQLKTFQANAQANFLTTQVSDVLRQAREGSRYIQLKRALAKHPQAVKSKNLSKLHEEQMHYQRRQLEIFDYLYKHFSQFEVMDFGANLPDVGKKFFAQIVVVIKAEIKELVEKSRRLLVGSEQQNKKLAKLRRQSQRNLEYLQAEINHSLVDGQTQTSNVIVKKNQDGKRLKAEIANLEALQTSFLNQINLWLDLGISQLKLLSQQLKTIVDQNQVVRGLLYELKDNNQLWQQEELRQKITQMFADFDQQLALTLNQSIEKRFAVSLQSEVERESFKEIVEELLQFQEYLGQVMMESYTLVQGNLDDLEKARCDYGILVLNFYGESHE